MSSVSRQQSNDNLVASPPTSPTTPFHQRRRQDSGSNVSLRQSVREQPRMQQRRASAASIASSIGGTLDTAIPEEGSQIFDYSQNAISTLLAPPIVRTGLVPHTSLPASSAYRAPTAREVPPVALTSIPHVESSSFKDYLSQVGPVFESFHRAKAASEEASRGATPRRTSNADDYFGDSSARRRRQDSISPAESPARSRRSSILSPPQTPSGGPKTPRSTLSRRAPNAPTPLTTIPNVYFEEDFHLENPRTFDVVSEFSEIIPPERGAVKDDGALANGSAKQPDAPPRKALHTNAILQEKLSWYMDTVEVHLISSIASASTSFFAALGSLRDLQAEAATSIEQIRDLRGALQTLDSEMTVGGLEVVHLRRRRENLGRLSLAVEQLCEVVNQARHCEDLVDEGDVGAANEAIDTLERLIDGKDPSSTETIEGQSKPRINLRKLKALDGVSDAIQDLRSRISRGYEDRFKGALLADLREHVKSVPAKDTLQRWANASFRGRPNHSRVSSTTTAYLKNNEELRPSLTSALAGLNKAGHTARATTAYREAVTREIKSMIRKHLPSSTDDDAESITSVSTRGGRKLTQQEKSAILARNLRALDAEATEELLIKVYTSIGEALRRLGVQVKVLLDVTSTIDMAPKEARKSGEHADGSASSASHQMSDEVTQALDLSSLLGQSVDLVQSQITKVLKVRRDETTHLPLQQFLRYFVLNRLFVDECEAVCGRGGDALKDVVNGNIKEFLSVMAEAQKQRINEVLESDRWEPKDFGPAENTVLSRVLEGMTSTPKAWTDYVGLWDSNFDASAPADGTMPNGSTNGDKAPEKARSASIDSQRYILVNSAQGAMYGIDAFAHVIAAIPQVTPDAANHLLSYLKLFNSRACQLILGAGATKTADLKNITTKHLALTSQACSFIVALLPYVRELVRRHLPPSSAASSTVLVEFDRVKRLFQDHQTSIHEKLVDIMGSRSAVHIAAFRKIDWDQQARQGQAAPSKCVEDLCKETNTLQKILGRHVSELDLKLIMNPIFSQYQEDWSKAVDEAVVKTRKGKERLHTDIDAIASRLGKMDGSEDLTKALLNAVQSKKPEDSLSDTEKLPSSETPAAAGEVTKHELSKSADPADPADPAEPAAEGAQSEKGQKEKT